MEKKTHYVLGFLFNEQRDKVILIKRNRPEWQAGFLNGVGGHINVSKESAHAAMIREFKEETGIDTKDIPWRKFCDLVGDGYDCQCFAAFDTKETNEFHKATTMTDEQIVMAPVVDAVTGTTPRIDNLSWLIPMALDKMDFYTTVKYK